jgi:hypothetical protein
MCETSILVLVRDGAALRALRLPLEPWARLSRLASASGSPVGGFLGLPGTVRQPIPSRPFAGYSAAMSAGSQPGVLWSALGHRDWNGVLTRDLGPSPIRPRRRVLF